jgi:hypothetical protein
MRIEITLANGIVGGLVLLLILILSNFLKYPERLDKWREIFFRFSSFLGKWFKKRRLSSDIEASISEVVEKSNREMKGLFTSKLRINWTSESDFANIKNGEIILNLNLGPNPDDNICRALDLYLPRAVIPRARHYVDKDIVTAIDFKMAKKILSKSKYSSAQSYYDESRLHPTLARRQPVTQYYSIVDNIDDKGFFTRILLREFNRYGNAVRGTIPDGRHMSETTDFLRFLGRIVSRAPGSKPPLSFMSERFHLAIVLIASLKTIHDYGLSLHFEAVHRSLFAGIDSLYLFSFKHFEDESIKDKDGRVVDVVKKGSFKLIEQMEKELQTWIRLRKLSKSVYRSRDIHGNMRDAMCIVYDVT